MSNGDHIELSDIPVRDLIASIAGAESQLNEFDALRARVEELEAQNKRLMSRGIGDLRHHNEELEAEVERLNGLLGEIEVITRDNEYTWHSETHATIHDDVPRITAKQLRDILAKREGGE